MWAMLLSLSLPVVIVGYVFVTITASGYCGLCFCRYHCQWLLWAMLLSLSLPVVIVGYASVAITASGKGGWAMLLSILQPVARVSVDYAFVTVTVSSQNGLCFCHYHCQWLV